MTLCYKILALWCIMNLMMTFCVVDVENMAGIYGPGISGSCCCFVYPRNRAVYGCRIANACVRHEDG